MARAGGDRERKKKTTELEKLNRLSTLVSYAQVDWRANPTPETEKAVNAAYKKWKSAAAKYAALPGEPYSASDHRGGVKIPTVNKPYQYPDEPFTFD